MNDLDRSILATLGFYAVFGRGLTFAELRERLIPASRLGGRNVQVSASVLLERLDVLCAIGNVINDSGVYTLSGSEGVCDKRIAQEKIWAQKWRRMLRRAWWLQSVPFVSALCASGSLALGSMSEGSDWDVFVIARSGRLYTARAGLLLVAWLTGSLRRKGDKVVADKFCFNHYVSTDGLHIRYRSLFTAHAFGGMIPFLERDDYLARFWQANSWIGDYRPMPSRAQFSLRTVRSSVLLSVIRRFLEVSLSTPPGGVVEWLLCRWQQSRIMREPATHEKGGRIVADRHQIEFHPRSFEARAIRSYNALLDRLGLGAHAEQDSGLT